MQEHFPELMGGLAAMQAQTARLSNGGAGRGLQPPHLQVLCSSSPTSKHEVDLSPKSQVFDCCYTEWMGFCTLSCLPI